MGEGGLPERTMLPADPDVAFDRIAELTRRVLGVPTALVSLVDDHHQAFPGAVGLPEPWQTERETPLTHSFCQHVVLRGEPLVIEDAVLDPLVATNEAITDLGVRAYAGMPLTDRAGNVVGSLCAIDATPRPWTEEQLANLADLAAACSGELQLREAADEAGEALRTVGRVVDSMPVGYAAYDDQWRVVTLNGEANRMVNPAGVDLTGRVVWDVFPEVADTEFGELLLRVARTGVPDLVEAYYPPPLDAWYESRAVPEAGGVAVFFVDVTARHAAEAKAREIVNSMPVGYCELDADLRYTYVNGEAARLCGLRPEQMAGRLQSDVFPRVDELPLVDAQRRVLATGRCETIDSYYPAPLDAWYEVRISRDEAGRVICYFVDITAQHSVQELLTQQAEHDRTVAQTLQSVLLTALPHVDGIGLAARYLTATGTEQVGGDWYDAVIRPDRALSVSIGDVCGHGLDAAAVMGQLRAMLRGFVWTSDGTPAEVVGRLDRASRSLHGRVLATMTTARINGAGPDGSRTMQWTNAGHPPPVLLLADGTTTVLERMPEMMLGVVPTTKRLDHTVALPAGSTLLLYTDGLVETRTHDLDHGIARLCAALQRHGTADTEALLDAVIAELLGDTRTDDVALLAVRIDA